MTDPRPSSRHRLAPALVAGAVVLLAGACTIQTEEDAATTTTEAPVVTEPPAPVDGAPPDTRPNANLDNIVIELEEIGEVDQPTAITTRMGSESIYIAEREGRVRELTRELKPDDNGIPYVSSERVERGSILDISGQVRSESPQEGLLGMAFSTDGSLLFLSYTDPDRILRVDRFDVNDGDIDRRSGQEMLAIEMPTDTNIGGQLQLGPDGFLYVAVGDGGGDGDPNDWAQDRTALHGSLLRIDPDGAVEDESYVVPLGNPYFDDIEADERVWLKGVRSPTFAFDELTGDLWVADRGQSEFEEVNWMSAADGPAGRGYNLGWAEMEAALVRDGRSDPEDDILPAYAYNREAGCSIVGGTQYRGGRIPAMQDAYVFGDACNGQIKMLRTQEGRIAQEKSFDVGIPQAELRGFATDPDDEMLVFTRGGTIYRVVPIEPE